MKVSPRSLLAAAACGLLATPLLAAEKDCASLALEVGNQIKADSSRALEVVQAQVGANEKCACEIVKAAIQATQADASLIARIVEVAATTAPDKMRIIAQCAVAVAPDSLGKVQAVLAKLDPNRGDGAGSDKGGMEKAPITEAAAVPNPLDFPVGGFGPRAGGPGGYPFFPPGLPPYTPPSVIPPVTDPYGFGSWVVKPEPVGG